MTFIMTTAIQSQDKQNVFHCHDKLMDGRTDRQAEPVVTVSSSL